ncbi:MAG: hypothetical protein ACI9O0_000916 [Paracoccaceae bacterium]
MGTAVFAGVLFRNAGQINLDVSLKGDGYKNHEPNATTILANWPQANAKGLQSAVSRVRVEGSTACALFPA